MNWDDARVFLAVCRESTLRGAARVLGWIRPLSGDGSQHWKSP